VSTSGGPTAPTKVSAGGTTPWVAPFGIAVSSDGNTLYVADTGANAGATPNDSGGLYSLATTAATPTLIPGSTGVYPRGITVEKSGSADTLFFTGSLSGTATVFSTPTAGGTPTKVASGAVDPSGIAADSSGNLYVVDTTGGPGGIASVLKVAMGASTTSVLLAGTYVGYPAGIAVDSAGNVILSGLTAPYGNDVLSSISSAGAATPFLTDATSLTALGKLTGAAGLHKASAANVYAFVDSAGLPSDAVYAIK
jgi:sugar lactone lactonase YvrE